MASEVRDNLESLLSEFRTHLSSLDTHSGPSEELKSWGLSALKKLFSTYKSFCAGPLGRLEQLPGCKHVDTGPLQELYTDGMDSDQIWEQLQLVNLPVMKACYGVVKDANEMCERGEFRVLANGLSEGEGESEGSVSRKGGEEAGEEADEEDMEDSEVEGSYVSEDEEGSEEEEEEEGGEGEGGGGPSSRRSVVDDRFFKLAEMERFLETAEREEGKGQLDIAL